MTDLELRHHGILGQKWGVRRYQNYDGSYTQAGLKRYNKSLDAYEKADARYKKAKQNKDDRVELTNARLAKKKAGRQLDKDYAALKQDKRADQGKELYSKGHTIRGNDKTTQFLASVATVSAGAAVATYAANIGRREHVSEYLAAVSALSAAAAATKQVVDASQAKKLRAYYGHGAGTRKKKEES